MTTHTFSQGLASQILTLVSLETCEIHALSKQQIVIVQKAQNSKTNKDSYNTRITEYI
jgi:nitrate reductase NapAB chaperone NapD